VIVVLLHTHDFLHGKQRHELTLSEEESAYFTWGIVRARVVARGSELTGTSPTSSFVKLYVLWEWYAGGAAHTEKESQINRLVRIHTREKCQNAVKTFIVCFPSGLTLECVDLLGSCSATFLHQLTHEMRHNKVRTEDHSSIANARECLRHAVPAE